MTYYEEAMRESAFKLGYSKALTNVVLLGCICHEQGPDERGTCPVCKAVEQAELKALAALKEK